MRKKISNPFKTVFECTYEQVPQLEEWKDLCSELGLTYNQRLYPYILEDIEKLKKQKKETLK